MTEGGNGLFANEFDAHVFAANLNYARLFSVSDGENCAEIKVVRNDDVIVCRRERHNLGVTRSRPTHGGLVHGFPARIVEEANPMR